MKPTLLNSNNFYHFIINYSSEIGLFAHSEGIYDNLLFYSKQKNKPTNTLTDSTCNNLISAARSPKFTILTVTNKNISKYKTECTAISDYDFAHVPFESSYLPIESSQCLFERFFDRFGNYWGMGFNEYKDNNTMLIKNWEDMCGFITDIN